MTRDLHQTRNRNAQLAECHTLRPSYLACLKREIDEMSDEESCEYAEAAMDSDVALERLVNQINDARTPTLGTLTASDYDEALRREGFDAQVGDRFDGLG